MADVKEQFREIKKRTAELGKATPEFMQAFGALKEVMVKHSVHDAKTKELIALMLALAARCVPCIMAHAQGAIDAGVTREEVVEAIEVAILMGGGPAISYGSIVLETYDGLKAK